MLCNGRGHREIPKDIPVNVEHLSLSNNRIRGIRSGNFSKFTSLKKLYLDDNEITQLPRYGFLGLSDLEVLSLRGNRLGSLEEYSLAGLKNIVQLVLEHNRIKFIEGSAFAATQNVHILQLGDNPIETLRSLAFSGLYNVSYLNLPTGIQAIESDAFNGLVGVGDLALTAMNLSVLRENAFRNLQNVSVLAVQRSHLGVVEPGAFRGLNRVLRLSLVKNTIDRFSELEISKENQVKDLNITGNLFKDVVSPGTLRCEAWGRVELENNLFPCDCRLRFLLDSECVRRRERDFFTKNFCHSPPELQNRRIADVDLNAVEACPEKTTPTVLYSSVSSNSRGSGIPGVASLLFVSLFQVFV